MSTVKIVILNWNGAEHLRRFLPSVVAAADGAGVVVADNGSTDDSLRLLREEFPGVEVVTMDANYGFAGGYDRALEHIEADYYVLLNSDVETPAGWLAPLIAELERHPDVAAVAPRLRSLCEPEKFEYAGAAGGYIDFLGYPFCRGRILKCTERDEGQYDDARDVFWVTGAAFCCRADVFRALGGFDADFFAHMEEIDLCWRMQLAGYRVRIVPGSTVYHLGGGTLQTDSPSKVFYNHRNNLAMLYKCSADAGPAGGPLLPGAGALGQLPGRGARLPRLRAVASDALPQAARDAGAAGLRARVRRARTCAAAACLRRLHRAALPARAPHLRPDDVTRGREKKEKKEEEQEQEKEEQEQEKEKEKEKEKAVSPSALNLRTM